MGFNRQCGIQQEGEEEKEKEKEEGPLDSELHTGQKGSKDNG
jgi:hypothetical protein